MSFCILDAKGVEGMPEVDVLAKQIKRYRQAQDMTQFEMSSEIGISEEELSLLERGKTDPKLSTIQKIASCMGITVAELLDTEDEEAEWTI